MGDADIFSECGHARNHEFCTQISALKFQGVSRCKFSCKNERDFRWRVEYRAAFPWSQISPVKLIFYTLDPNVPRKRLILLDRTDRNRKSVVPRFL
jgi:hypothetical protein